jgi:hypothetical protein
MKVNAVMRRFITISVRDRNVLDFSRPGSMIEGQTDRSEVRTGSISDFSLFKAFFSVSERSFWVKV